MKRDLIYTYDSRFLLVTQKVTGQLTHHPSKDFSAGFAGLLHVFGLGWLTALCVALNIRPIQGQYKSNVLNSFWKIFKAIKPWNRHSWLSSHSDRNGHGNGNGNTRFSLRIQLAQEKWPTLYQIPSAFVSARLKKAWLLPSSARSSLPTHFLERCIQVLESSLSNPIHFQYCHLFYFFSEKCTISQDQTQKVTSRFRFKGMIVHSYSFLRTIDEVIIIITKPFLFQRHPYSSI